MVDTKKLKTVAKKLVAKSYMPILRSGMVKGGYIHFTNLDMLIRARLAETLSDGMVDYESFHDNGLTIEDYANCEEFLGEHIQWSETFEVPAEVLKWMRKASHPDECRYVLKGVFVDIKDNALVSSDGRRLNVAEMTFNPSIKEFYSEIPVDKEHYSFTSYEKTARGINLPGEFIDLCLSYQGKGSLTFSLGLERTETPDKDVANKVNVTYRKRVSFIADGICIYSKDIEGCYPDYQKVMPDKVSECPLYGAFDFKSFVKSEDVKRVIQRTKKLLKSFHLFSGHEAKAEMQVDQDGIKDGFDIMIDSTAGDIKINMFLSPAYVMDIVNFGNCVWKAYAHGKLESDNLALCPIVFETLDQKFKSILMPIKPTDK